MGVLWADLNDDNTLELVAVGDDNSSEPDEWPNYIYKYHPEAGSNPGDPNNFQVDSQFNSAYQLVRVVSGDFDNKNGLDLIASSTILNAEWPVCLYRNNGSGQFGDNGEHINASYSGGNQLTSASAALAPADYNNDGKLDLALSQFQTKQIWILKNDGTNTPFNTSDVASPVLVVDRSLPFIL